ncbi:MAG: hypothetical protein V1871_04680 [Planctomycetota bacterium]
MLIHIKQHKVIICLIVIIVFWSSQASSFTVQLKNGSYLTGEITSYDSNGFEIKCWYNNGILKLKWYHLNKEEAHRLRIILSVPQLNRDIDEIDASIIYSKSGPIYDGILTEQTSSYVQVKTISGVKNISLNDIIKTERIKVNPLKIYTSQEWYLEKIKTFNLEDASDNFQLAEYCKTVLKLYEKAKEHYYKSAQLSPLYKEEANKKISELTNITLQEKIDEIEKLILTNDSKSLDQAKEILAKLKNDKSSTDTQIAKIIGELEAKIKDKEKNISSKSEKESYKKIYQQYYSALKSLIKKICEQNMSYPDTISYVNTMIYKQIITKLAKDNKMAEDEVANIIGEKSPAKLEDIPRREISYGDGSWLVSQNTEETSNMDPEKFAKYLTKIKAISEAKDKAAQKNELITSDTWWKNVSSTQREKFLEASFAEKYMYFIERKQKPCNLCSGEGVINKNICKQCWGTMVEIIIAYK